MRQQELTAGCSEFFNFHAQPKRVAIQQHAQNHHLVGLVQVGGLQHSKPSAERADDLLLRVRKVILLATKPNQEPKRAARVRGK
jgi:hypothetical protein